MFGHVWDPTFIDPALDSRAVTFENLSGERGAGGAAAGGRKGAPSRRIEAGGTVVLADLEGPGTIRHIWFTVPPSRPEKLRSLTLEVTYDGRSEPSISVPILDFFGLPHGRRAEVYSTMLCANEGRGFNSYIPMPFERSIQVTFHNGSAEPVMLFYQVDYTLEPGRTTPPSYLHASFRRENPTTLKRDFTIVDGLRGPGRFLGCCVGVRVLDDGRWYGEGEVKVYRDGDTDLPTICGTGLEDYVGTGWGLNRHLGPYAGAPLDLRSPRPDGREASNPDFVGFYRFHLADPIMFATDLRVTIQQIGYAMFFAGQEERFEDYKARHEPAGSGWATRDPRLLGSGIVERVDDYCATAWVFCREPQSVPRVDFATATADLARMPYEHPEPMEAFIESAGGVAAGAAE